jgi:hypothetical protein
MKKRKSKKLIYEELLNQYRPTVRSLLVEILRVKLFNLQKGKEPIIREGATFVPEDDRLKHLPLKYLAVVDKKNKVLEMIRINEETAEFLLNKENLLIEFNPKTDIVKKGMTYNNGKFAEDKDEEKN